MRMLFKYCTYVLGINFSFSLVVVMVHSLYEQPPLSIESFHLVMLSLRICFQGSKSPYEVCGTQFKTEIDILIIKNLKYLQFTKVESTNYNNILVLYIRLVKYHSFAIIHSVTHVLKEMCEIQMPRKNSIPSPTEWSTLLNLLKISDKHLQIIFVSQINIYLKQLSLSYVRTVLFFNIGSLQTS